MARRNRDKLQLEIAKAGVSRAIYIGSKETPRMLFSLVSNTGQEIEFELDVSTAHSLIEQMISTYYIISPPLRTNRGAFGRS